jgi:hypothetical protein
MVNFDDFVALVGIKKDYNKSHTECSHIVNNYTKKNPDGSKKTREDAKFVMRLLISRGVRVAGMR